MSDHQRDDWADKLALLLARQRTGGDVHMDGGSDPLPTERAVARRFMGDLAAAGFRRPAPNPEAFRELLSNVFAAYMIPANGVVPIGDHEGTRRVADAWAEVCVKHLTDAGLVGDQAARPAAAVTIPPSGVPHAAVVAALEGQMAYDAEDLDGERPKNDAYFEAQMERALEAALPHLTGLIRPVADEATVEHATVADALYLAGNMMASDPRNWGLCRRDAWLYGLILGWDCEEDHAHDDVCANGEALRLVAERHHWGSDDVARLRRYRAAIGALVERNTK